MLSMTGIMRKSPGPRTTWNRPSRKTTARSHWLATLVEDEPRITIKTNVATELVFTENHLSNLDRAMVVVFVFRKHFYLLDSSFSVVWSGCPTGTLVLKDDI